MVFRVYKLIFLYYFTFSLTNAVWASDPCVPEDSFDTSSSSYLTPQENEGEEERNFSNISAVPQRSNSASYQPEQDRNPDYQLQSEQEDRKKPADSLELNAVNSYLLKDNEEDKKNADNKTIKPLMLQVSPSKYHMASFVMGTGPGMGKQGLEVGNYFSKRLLTPLFKSGMSGFKRELERKYRSVRPIIMSPGSSLPHLSLDTARHEEGYSNVMRAHMEGQARDYIGSIEGVMGSLNRRSDTLYFLSWPEYSLQRYPGTIVASEVSSKGKDDEVEKPITNAGAKYPMRAEEYLNFVKACQKGIKDLSPGIVAYLPPTAIYYHDKLEEGCFPASCTAAFIASSSSETLIMSKLGLVYSDGWDLDKYALGEGQVSGGMQGPVTIKINDPKEGRPITVVAAACVDAKQLGKEYNIDFFSISGMGCPHFSLSEGAKVVIAENNNNIFGRFGEIESYGLSGAHVSDLFEAKFAHPLINKSIKLVGESSPSAAVAFDMVLRSLSIDVNKTKLVAREGSKFYSHQSGIKAKVCKPWYLKDIPAHITPALWKEVSENVRKDHPPFEFYKLPKESAPAEFQDHHTVEEHPHPEHPHEGIPHEHPHEHPHPHPEHPHPHGKGL